MHLAYQGKIIKSRAISASVAHKACTYVGWIWRKRSLNGDTETYTRSLPDLKFRSDLFYRLPPSPPDRFYRLSSSVSEDAGHENLKFRSPLLICEPRNICARVIILRQRHGQGDWRDQRCAWACQVYIPLYVHTLAFFNALSTLMSSVALSFRCRCGKAVAVEIQAPYSGARGART